MEALLLEIGKRQLDMTLGVLEATLDAAGKLYEVQLSALVEAHACVVATRRALQGATSIAELGRVQSDCLSKNIGAMAAYWQAVGTIARETQSRIAQPATAA